MLPSKTLSWTLLIIFFVFDNFFSYYAITRLHGREANLLIAPLVEAHPWLYFLCIPATILIMLTVVWAIKGITSKLLARWIKNNATLERITLGAIVVYWAIGNSSMNLAFLLGHRLPI